MFAIKPNRQWIVWFLPDIRKTLVCSLENVPTCENLNLDKELEQILHCRSSFRRTVVQFSLPQTCSAWPASLTLIGSCCKFHTILVGSIWVILNTDRIDSVYDVCTIGACMCIQHIVADVLTAALKSSFGWLIWNQLPYTWWIFLPTSSEQYK